MNNELKYKVENHTINGQQLQVCPNGIDEGIKIALEKNIKSLMLRSFDDVLEKNVTVDFSWLKELPDLESLEIGIPLSKKSNIEGIYELKKLKNLHYSHYDNVPLDHNKLKSLEHLYTCYSKSHKREECSFELLENLNSLKLWHVKEEENCCFLGKINELLRLELTWSRSINSLKGIEKYKLLENICLRNLSQLEDISALNKLSGIKRLWIESCKNINEEGKKNLTMFRKNIYTNGY